MKPALEGAYSYAQYRELVSDLRAKIKHLESPQQINAIKAEGLREFRRKYFDRLSAVMQRELCHEIDKLIRSEGES